MLTYRSLEEAPRLTEFLGEIRQRETGSGRYEVHARELRLRPTGELSVNSDSINGKFPLAEPALPDLARAAQIPDLYFESCQQRLFDRRYHRAQSAISKALNRLEARGLVRLIRHAQYVKKLELTENGRAMAEELNHDMAYERSND